MLVALECKKLESKAIEDEHFDKQLSRKQELKCYRDVKLLVRCPGIALNKQDQEVYICNLFNEYSVCKTSFDLFILYTG